MTGNNTKIVCTIGPATWDPAVMKKMIENGMNVARVNGAFADPDELDKVRDLVRQFSDDVSLMVDIKGPEVRMNKFDAPIKIKPGDEIIVGDENDEIYPANYPDLYKYVEPGQRFLVGDGDVEMVVKKLEGKRMYCEVVFGELLKPGKALNAPGCDYASDILTEKDKVNLTHAINTGWEFCSPSFIQNAKSAQTIIDYIGDAPMKVIAKIEDQEGVNNIDEILELVDGIMIARGGLGVELGLEKVPMVQRFLTRKANQFGKPVITATQILESMTYNPRPTRAEVNDAALAVLLGSDALMLSGESSAGEYPTEAVAELTKISKEIGKDLEPRIVKSKKGTTSPMSESLTKSVAEFAINMGDHIDKILVVSESGETARLLSRHRLLQPIYALCGSEFNARTLMLSKGILGTGVLEGTRENATEFVAFILQKAQEKGFVGADERVLIVSRNHQSSHTNWRNIFEVVNTKHFLG